MCTLIERNNVVIKHRYLRGIFVWREFIMIDYHQLYIVVCRFLYDTDVGIKVKEEK